MVGSHYIYMWKGIPDSEHDKVTCSCNLSFICKKKHLYISLVPSRLPYCSQLWRPQLMKNILLLEKVQRRATEYILNYFSSDYKTRLTKLNILPLMFWLELQDILFLVKCFKQPSHNINIFSYVSFASSCTRSLFLNKLRYNFHRSTKTRHQFFNLCGPTMELTNTNRPLSHLHQSRGICFYASGSFFRKYLYRTIKVPFTASALVSATLIILTFHLPNFTD